MKAIVKGNYLPIAYVGSKSFRFHQGSTGIAVKGLPGWRVEPSGSATFGDLSPENRAVILEAVKRWLSDKTTKEFEIEHSWQKVKESNLSALGVNKNWKLFNDCHNEGGEGYNPYPKY